MPDIRFVQVQTHSRCNADCVFCPYIESWHAAHHGRMSDETWLRILDQLQPFAAGINKGKFLPYLMQEPLIDSTIFSKMEDVYARFPSTKLELSTNGSALVPPVVEKLVDCLAHSQRKHEIWISHHGVDQPSLEAIMKLDHSKAQANIIRLLKASEGRLKIRLRGLGSSRDGQHVFFTHKQYHRYWEDLMEQHQINPKRIHIDSYTFHDRAATLHRTDRGAHLLNQGTVREIDSEHPFYCPRVDLWVHFLWNGQLRLCCMDYHGEVSLPNINEISLPEYFHSEAFQHVYRQLLGQQNSAEDFICKRCTSPGG